MSVYKCTACGYRWDEEQEDRQIEALTKCPLCEGNRECFVIDSGIAVPVVQSFETPQSTN